MKNKIIVDAFPINSKKLPPLHCYTLESSAPFSSIKAMATSLSFYLKYQFQGNWAAVDKLIFSDIDLSQEELAAFLPVAWQKNPSKFSELTGLSKISDYEISEYQLAHFYSKAIFFSRQNKINNILQAEAKHFDTVSVERKSFLNGALVNEQPSLLISTKSETKHKSSLKEYCQHNPMSAVDLEVEAKTSKFKGKVISVVGTMKENRERLLNLSTIEETKHILSSLDDNELVVKVKGRNMTLDYAVSQLNVIVYTKDLHKLSRNAQQIMNSFKLPCTDRKRIVDKIKSTLPSSFVGERYNSDTHPHLFLSAEQIGFLPKIKMGNGVTTFWEPKKLLWGLQSNGLYNKSIDTLNMGLIDFRSQPAKQTIFGKKLREIFRKMGITTKFIGTEIISDPSKSRLEAVINAFEAKSANIIMAIFSDDVKRARENGISSESYNVFKELTIGRGIASQAIYDSTLDNDFATGNVAMGILGKTGNVPYVLASPLPYADFVVGIDVSRIRKENANGTMNAVATTRVYCNDGAFLQYAMPDALIEGEAIPEKVLQNLLPSNLFAGKRTLIHRDGRFLGNEYEAIKRWGKEIGAEFYFVEVTKTGAPRMYSESSSGIGLPPKGTLFKLSDSSGFLVSSLPPFGGHKATPAPLKIKTRDDFPIEQAAHSVLALTLLHYGSMHAPRLPITTHYGDKIAYLAINGIKPRQLEGNCAYWL